MKVKPLEDNILIERQTPEEKNKHGVYMLTDKEQMEVATIVSVPTTVKTVKKGDKILFKNYNIDTITYDNVDLVFIKCENIIAIVA